MREHKNGKCYTTSHMGTIELIHYEAYKSENDARRRELYLKTTQGKRMIKLMLRESLI
jgi:predicted GIY-YIG superfamily endonuclease